tara:strand:- start:439 stop:717 length:279 start_codon:yes stop_codon:yes gene_type:complete
LAVVEEETHASDIPREEEVFGISSNLLRKQEPEPEPEAFLRVLGELRVGEEGADFGDSDSAEGETVPVFIIVVVDVKLRVTARGKPDEILLK